MDSTGHYLLQLQDKTAAETEMLYINPSTFELSKGPAPSSGSTISTYTPSTSGSGSLAVVVTATGVGITAVRGSGTLTVTIPTGVTLLSARVTGDDAENDGIGQPDRGVQRCGFARQRRYRLTAHSCHPKDRPVGPGIRGARAGQSLL